MICLSQMKPFYLSSQRLFRNRDRMYPRLQHMKGEGIVCWRTSKIFDLKERCPELLQRSCDREENS